MISIPIFCVSLLHISSVVKGYVYDLEIILLFVIQKVW
jgi:predicted RNA-binding protein with RPS1 domain